MRRGKGWISGINSLHGPLPRRDLVTDEDERSCRVQQHRAIAPRACHGIVDLLRGGHVVTEDGQREPAGRPGGRMAWDGAIKVSHRAGGLAEISQDLAARSPRLNVSAVDRQHPVEDADRRPALAELPESEGQLSLQAKIAWGALDRRLQLGKGGHSQAPGQHDPASRGQLVGGSAGIARGLQLARKV